MKIAVTGAAGFVGQHLVEHLAGHGHEVFGFDRHPAFRVYVTYDMRADGVAERMFRRVEPDVVVHLAAQVGRVFGEDDLEHTISSNVLLTTRVAQAAAEVGARLVYASTSEVYGDQGDRVCNEDTPVQVPHNAYGLTKYQGEQMAALYAPEGLQVLRLSMPFGPGLPAGRGRAAIVNFLYNAYHGLPVTVHRGSRRCWCWVGDTVDGIRRVIEAGEQARSAGEWIHGTGVFNVGRDDNERSMLEVAELACDIAGASRDLIVEVDAPSAQTVVKRLGTGKLQGLGWSPAVELEDGMTRMFEMVRAMPAPVKAA